MLFVVRKRWFVARGLLLVVCGMFAVLFLFSLFFVCKCVW